MERVMDVIKKVLLTLTQTLWFENEKWFVSIRNYAYELNHFDVKAHEIK